MLAIQATIYPKGEEDAKVGPSKPAGIKRKAEMVDVAGMKTVSQDKKLEPVMLKITQPLQPGFYRTSMAVLTKAEGESDPKLGQF